MLDVITYVQDTVALVAELREKYPDMVSEEGDFLIDKTPTVKNAQGHTLALVRGDDDKLLELGENLDNLTILGTYEDIFADPDLLEIYDSVYDRTPKTFDDITITPPDKFGVFA